MDLFKLQEINNYNSHNKISVNIQYTSHMTNTIILRDYGFKAQISMVNH
jgi:hypothetical protein